MNLDPETGILKLSGAPEDVAIIQNDLIKGSKDLKELKEARQILVEKLGKEHIGVQLIDQKIIDIGGDKFTLRISEPKEPLRLQAPADSQAGEQASTIVEVNSSESYGDSVKATAMLTKTATITPRFSMAEVEAIPIDVLKRSSFQNISEGGGRGFRIMNSQNQTLRKFLDTNGDIKLDQWIYYQDGKETYRDVDQDFDGKVDHFYMSRDDQTLAKVDFPVPDISELPKSVQVLKEQMDEAKMKMEPAKKVFDTKNDLIRKGFLSPKQIGKDKEKLKEATLEYEDAKEAFTERLLLSISHKIVPKVPFLGVVASQRSTNACKIAQ